MQAPMTERAMHNLRILVLGAGGVGGYFGGRLAESGADVTFLVRKERQASLVDCGLQIESAFGDATVAVKTVVSDHVAPVYDVILLTCKAYDLDAAVDAIAPAMVPMGFVLPLLDGVAHIELLNHRFGQDRVLGGTAKIQTTLTPDGAIRQFSDWRTITFGEQSGLMTDRVEQLATLFAKTKGVEVLAVADIRQRMWEKLVHLTTAATMTSLMRANIGEIVRTPDGRDIFLDQLRISAAIAAANGHQPSDAFMQGWAQTFSQSEPTYSTLMLRSRYRLPHAAACLHAY
jgi:2-dehydropantoate 2-reductase